jgi:hypothetical protein
MLTKIAAMLDGLFEQTIIIKKTKTEYIKLVPNQPTADGRFHLVTNPNPPEKNDGQ